MKLSYFLLILGLSFASCSVFAPTKKLKAPELNNFYDSASYAWGLNIAEFLKGYYYSELDAELMTQAFNSSMNNQPVAFSSKEVKSIIKQYGEYIVDSIYNYNDSLGMIYLNEFGQKPGVVKLESGIQYELISKGWGETYPVQGDRLIVHYECFTVDGKKVDSSVDKMEPYEFVIGLGKVIKGWEEISLLMKEGDKLRVVIPATQAYEKNISVKGIPPGSTLIYELKILEIKPIHLK